MERNSALGTLEDFAKECLRADNYPDDYHYFSEFKCHSCNSSVLKINIEHHTGSEEWKFKGIIWGECGECGYILRIFTFTGEHREYLREEKPVCECGNKFFFAGMCERIEGELGLTGFFDEGVVVGKCNQCLRNQAFVYTD